MKKLFISLNKTNESSSSGWSASIAIEQGGQNGQNKYTISESEIYPNIEQAWKSIVKRAEALGFNNDEIYFNKNRVYCFEEVLRLVSLL